MILRRAAASCSVLVQHHSRLFDTPAAALATYDLRSQRTTTGDSGSPALALLAAGGAAVLGASLLPSTVAASEPAPQLVPGDPYALPTEVKGVPTEIIMYQYEVCPYCNKVKAFLDYHKLPYRTIEVSPITKAELKWSEHRKVPLVLLDQEPLADSSAIISRLSAELRQQQQQPQPESQGWFSRWRTQPNLVQEPAADESEEERWRRWVDDRLVKVVTVNIYRNMGESFQTFNYITDTGKFGLFEGPATRASGAVIMWFIARRLVGKYGIKGDLRQELFKVADEWSEGLQDRQFMGGEAPNLADLSAFGVIRSITGTDTFMDLMHQTKISEWYEHMMGAVGDSARLSAT